LFHRLLNVALEWSIAVCHNNEKTKCETLKGGPNASLNKGARGDRLVRFP